jgi:Flp pilus assembly protein TadG
MSKSACSSTVARRLGATLRSEKGVTALEFAMIALPLLMLLLYTMDLARYWYTTEALRSYTAEVMRAALITTGSDNPPTVNTCTASVANTAAVTPGLDPSRLVVQVACTRNNSAQGYVVSRTVNVTTRYRFDFAVGALFWNENQTIAESQTTTF